MVERFFAPITALRSFAQCSTYNSTPPLKSKPQALSLKQIPRSTSQSLRYEGERKKGKQTSKNVKKCQKVPEASKKGKVKTKKEGGNCFLCLILSLKWCGGLVVARGPWLVVRE
jgi:hypothetical protein